MQLLPKFQLFGLIIALVSAVAARSDTNKRLKLTVKEFAKIDSHLNKKVASDNVESYMREIEIWLKNESSKFIKHKSLIEDLKRFQFVEQIQNAEYCLNGSGRTFLEDFDRSLGYDAIAMSRQPIRPIDRISKYYAFNFAEFCRDQTDSIPNLEVTFKQADYDIIDAHLTSKVSTDDLDENLHEAGLMVKHVPAVSHLAEALDQFLSLKRLISGIGSCNYDGYQIRFKNDLAIRGASKVKVASRRVDRIIFKAAEKHGLICLGEYRKNYNTIIQNLDESVKKTMRILADNYLKPLNNLHWDYDLMEPEVSKDTTHGRDDTQDRLVSDNEVVAARETVETLAEGSSDSKFCKAFGNNEDKIVNLNKLYECYDKYLLKPCKIFMEIIGKEVFVPQSYDPSNDGTIALPTREDDKLSLSYNHGQAASLVCTRLIKNNRWISLRLAEKEVGL